jgi:hypothetical protein
MLFNQNGHDWLFTTPPNWPLTTMWREINWCNKSLAGQKLIRELKGYLEMSRAIKIIRRFIFVIFICAYLSYSLIAMEQPGMSPTNNSSNVSSYSTQSASGAELLSGDVSASSYFGSESLLLLFSGIVMFIGATTIRKSLERSRAGRNATPRKNDNV